jgi:hypothetical protein
VEHKVCQNIYSDEKSERQMVDQLRMQNVHTRYDQNNIKITKINHYFQQKKIVKQPS